MQGVQAGRLARGSGRAEYGRAVGCCPTYVVPAVGRNSHHPSGGGPRNQRRAPGVATSLRAGRAVAAAPDAEVVLDTGAALHGVPEVATVEVGVDAAEFLRLLPYQGVEASGITGMAPAARHEQTMERPLCRGRSVTRRSVPRRVAR